MSGGRQGRPKGMTLEERFWEKVAKGPGCWLWTGGTTKDGYGIFALTTTRGNVTFTTAHRQSWEMHFGPVPDGLRVLHACDNPPCVWPGHLMLGTQQANITDAVRKGRMRPGGRSAA